MTVDSSKTNSSQFQNKELESTDQSLTSPELQSFQSIKSHIQTKKVASKIHPFGKDTIQLWKYQTPHQLLSNGYALCHAFEKIRLHPYKDHKGIPTIGIGMTWYPNGRIVTINDEPLTGIQAEFLYGQLFDIHIWEAIQDWEDIFFEKCPTAFQNAFASFVYNTGYVYGVNGYNTMNSLIDEIIQLNNSTKWNKSFIDELSKAWMFYDDDRFDDGVQNNSTGLSIRRYAEVLILRNNISAAQAYKLAYQRGNDLNNPLDPLQANV